MELKLKAAKEPNIEADDMDEDREGFTEEAFQFIKSNNDLSVITNIANASLYSVRNNCEVYSTKILALTPCNKKETFDSLTYNSQMDGNVAKNNRQNREIEVILHADFYEKMLRKEYDSRLRMDYFSWQTKIDKLMFVSVQYHHPFLKYSIPKVSKGNSKQTKCN